MTDNPTLDTGAQQASATGERLAVLANAPCASGLLDAIALAEALGVSANAVKSWVKHGLRPNTTTRTPNNRPKHLYRLADVQTWCATHGNFVRAYHAKGAAPQTTPRKARVSKKDYAAATGDFEQVLARARIVEKKAFENYADKLAQASEIEKLAAQKQYIDAAEQLKKLELAAPEILQAAKTLIAKAEVEKELAEIATNIKNDLLALPQKIAPLLAGKTEIDIEQIIKAEITAALRHIAGGG